MRGKRGVRARTGRRVALFGACIATALSITGCTAIWRINATYPQQIPVAAKLTTPPGFVDDKTDAPHSHLVGNVWVACAGAYTFGCHPATVSRAWRSSVALTTREACRRFGTWSYDHGIRVLNYAAYTGGDQKWHVFKIPDPSTPQFKQFVALCLDEVLGTHDHEGQGAFLDGTPTDLCAP